MRNLLLLLLGRDLLLLLLNNALLRGKLLLGLLDNISLLGRRLLLGLLKNVPLLGRILLLDLGQLPVGVGGDCLGRHKAQSKNDEDRDYSNRIYFHFSPLHLRVPASLRPGPIQNPTH